jgi:hypothetical protein
MQLLRFSSPREIMALTVIWMASMFGLDAWKNPQTMGSFFKSNVAGRAAANVQTPTVRLWLNHLCCSGCLDDLKEGLKPVAWVKEVSLNGSARLPDKKEADALPDTALKNGANWVDLQITDTRRVDFVELDKALRAAGFAADRMEISGISHFRIQAELNHMSCKSCSRAVSQGLDLAKSFRSKGQFMWLDSSAVDYDQKLVTVFPRYDSVVDVAELIAGLNHLGFAPQSARLLLGDHD